MVKCEGKYFGNFTATQAKIPTTFPSLVLFFSICQ